MILNMLFGGELENGTILLLQALTPVRFAFLDGQARMSAMHFYERKLLPSLYNTVTPLFSLDRVFRSWSLSHTSTPAECIFLTWNGEGDGSVSADILDEMKRSSKHAINLKTAALGDLSSMSPPCVSDFVSHMLANGLKSYTPCTASQLPDRVENTFYDVFCELRKFDVELSRKMLRGFNIPTKLTKEKEIVDFAFNKTYGKMTSKRFQSLKKPPGGGSTCAHTHLIMAILGAVMCDSTSLGYLKRCMDKDWIIPITDSSQVHGVPLNELHPGTFVNDSIDGTWFLGELHLVSDDPQSVP
jgi:hypothetical protein